MGFTWQTNTAPFLDRTTHRPDARFVLEQIDDERFRLTDEVHYEGRAGTYDIPPFATDLASIPRFMSWFASRHGRHTPAALLHDYLIPGGPQDPVPPPVPRHEADEKFRIVLDELGVPLVRARIMWAGVTFATRVGSGIGSLVAMIAWLVAALAGTVVLVWGLSAGNPWLYVPAALVPIAAAVLWGPQWRAGLIGGYALWLVLVPALVSWLGYKLYQAVELVFLVRFPLRALGRAVLRRPGPPSPPAAQVLPTPYGKR